MAKAKSKSTVLVAGAAGGMVKVEDRRFDRGEWPIRFEVPRGELSEKWLQYFGAECCRRSWRIVGIGQLERRENSGSVTVNTELGNPQLAVVWERRRDGPIAVRARSLESLPLPETHGTCLIR